MSRIFATCLTAALLNCAACSTHDIEKMVSYFTNDCVYEALPSG